MNSQGRRGNLIALASSVIVCLVLGEIVTRLFLPAPLPWLYPQLRYSPDPDLIFKLKVEQRAFSADKPVWINERGLRGKTFPYQHPPGGEQRLLFLGDSIVFGYGVKEEDGVVSRVSRLLLQGGLTAESINTGVPSYNTEQEIRYLEKEGLRYQPNWVILGVCWNDVNSKSEVFVSPEGWLGEKLEGAKSLPTGWGESPTGYHVRNLLKESRLAYAVMQSLRYLYAYCFPNDYGRFQSEVLEGRDSARVAEGWQRLRAAVNRFKQLSVLHGFRPLVVAFPSALSLERHSQHNGYPDRVRQMAEQDDLPYIDLAESFRSAYHGHDSLYIPYDGDHPNAVGHDLAARVIAGAIMRESGLDVSTNRRR